VQEQSQHQPKGNFREEHITYQDSSLFEINETQVKVYTIVYPSRNVSINSMVAQTPPPRRLLGILNCTCSQGRAFAFCRLAPGWGIFSRLKSRIFIACFAI
jgi:hypothetical protein